MLVVLSFGFRVDLPSPSGLRRQASVILSPPKRAEVGRHRHAIHALCAISVFGEDVNDGIYAFSFFRYIGLMMISRQTLATLTPSGL